MTEVRLIWKREGDWTIFTSPDMDNFLVASTDEAVAFADIPVVWNRLLQMNKGRLNKLGQAQCPHCSGWHVPANGRIRKHRLGSDYCPGSGVHLSDPSPIAPAPSNDGIGRVGREQR